MEENNDVISTIREEIKNVKLDIINKLDKLDELLECVNDSEDDL